MGFQIPRKTAQIQFEGDEFSNCEIKVALDLTFEATDHMDELQKKGDQKASISFFTENCILSWNLVGEKGEALPISVESFYAFPGWFALAVMNGYAAAVKKAAGVSGPLGGQSKNGASSEEQSAMTEAPSSVLPN